MFDHLRDWYDTRRLQQRGLDALWPEAVAGWPLLAQYQPEVQAQLRDMALRFVVRKHIIGGAGFAVTDLMRLRVAAQAVVPVLGLGLDWYQDWNAVVLYEGAFIPHHEWEDENGIVHAGDMPLSGEAWPHGPVILSWEDVLASDDPEHAGYDVVIHEMAHKLDMRGAGGANGAPPLHRGMEAQRWHDVMQQAWDSLSAAEAEGRELPLDPYGLEDAGEFFAVLSECFFSAPHHVQDVWPEAYAQLRAFYRQDPLRGSLLPA